jgi:hypothetical protein
VTVMAPASPAVAPGFGVRLIMTLGDVTMLKLPLSGTLMIRCGPGTVHRTTGPVVEHVTPEDTSLTAASATAATAEGVHGEGHLIRPTSLV